MVVRVTRSSRPTKYLLDSLTHSSRRPTVDKVLGHAELKQEGEERRTCQRRRQHQYCLSSQPSHHARRGVIRCVISCIVEQLLEWMPRRTALERGLTQYCRLLLLPRVTYSMYITGSRRVLTIFRKTMAGRDRVCRCHRFTKC